MCKKQRTIGCKLLTDIGEFSKEAARSTAEAKRAESDKASAKYDREQAKKKVKKCFFFCLFAACCPIVCPLWYWRREEKERKKQEAFAQFQPHGRIEPRSVEQQQIDSLLRHIRSRAV